MKLPSLCIQDEVPVTEEQIPAQEVKIVCVNTDTDLIEPWKVVRTLSEDGPEGSSENHVFSGELG